MLVKATLRVSPNLFKDFPRPATSSRLELEMQWVSFCVRLTQLKVAFDVLVLTHCLCLFGRVFWRSAVSGVSEFLNGGHGSAAAW